MKLRIDGVERDPAVATFSEKSYGKHAGTRTGTFSLEINADEFLSRFAPAYDECLAELRRDDAATGKFHPPFPGATDYPSIDQLFRLPASSRMVFIDTYLVFDILRMFLREDAEGKAVEWLVERCDSIDRVGAVVVLRGIVQVLPR